MNTEAAIKIETRDGYETRTFKTLAAAYEFFATVQSGYRSMDKKAKTVCVWVGK